MKDEVRGDGMPKKDHNVQSKAQDGISVARAIRLSHRNGFPGPYVICRGSQVDAHEPGDGLNELDEQEDTHHQIRKAADAIVLRVPPTFTDRQQRTPAHDHARKQEDHVAPVEDAHLPPSQGHVPAAGGRHIRVE